MMSAMFVEKILSFPPEMEMKDGDVTIDTVQGCNSGSWKIGNVYHVLTPEKASILTGAG